MKKRTDKEAVSPYTHILVPLENSKHDRTILDHVRLLANFCGAKITLIHVADGFMARNIERFPDSSEVREDATYLEKCRNALEEEGFEVSAVLECGDPAKCILAVAAREKCDLIAMATHGHRALADVILGSVASAIRHSTEVPVLLVKSSLKK